MSGKVHQKSGGKRRGEGRDQGKDQNTLGKRSQQQGQTKEVGSSSRSAEIVNPDEHGGKLYAESESGNPNPAGETIVNLEANHFKINHSLSEKIIYKHEIEKIEVYNKNLGTFEPSKNKTRSRTLLKRELSGNRIMAIVGDYIFSGNRLNFENGILQLSICKLEVTEENLELKLEKLAKYCSTEEADNKVVQGLETIMREHLAEREFRILKRYRKYILYHEPSNEAKFKGPKNNYCAREGFKQSIKVTSNGVSLCLDYLAVVFHKQDSVFEYIKKNVRGFKDPDKDFKRYSKQIVNLLKKKTLEVCTAIHGVKRKYTVYGLTNRNAEELTFEWTDQSGENGDTISVNNYFKKRYDVDVPHPLLPCLNIRTTGNPIFIPIGLCYLVGKDHICLKKDDPKVIPINVGDRKRKIKNVIDTLYKNRDVDFEDFQIQVEETMTKVTGRVIPSPKFSTIDDPDFLGRVKLEKWCLIDFRKDVQGHRLSTTNKFAKALKTASKHFVMQPIVVAEDANNIEQLLEQIVHRHGDLQIIICMVSGKNYSGYDRLKWISETKIGVMTQCLDYNTYFEKEKKDAKNKRKDAEISGEEVKPSAAESYLQNLFRKINQKINGKNMEIKEPLHDFGDDDGYVMLIGADVNHPPPNDDSSPSIAAVVGTVNWPAVDRYIARIRQQSERKEKIENFGAMCKDIINTFDTMNGKKPDKILIFRDGVGESQIKSFILDGELKDFKEAFSGEDYNPEIVVVLAQKRHHTRLFRNDKGTIKNVGAGTVVDTVIVDPSPENFYLYSHDTCIGTSKPIHYIVLHNNNIIELKKLEELIYKLCFTYANCAKSISLVPPIYYADKAAYRGRKYYNACKEINPDGLVNDDTFKLHENLENAMFFL